MKPPHDFDTSNLLDCDDYLDEDILDADFDASPTKKKKHTTAAFEPLGRTPDLRFQSNELFQMTHHLHEGHEKLHNDKIEKLLSQLNHDYELDDQLRTRVFKGRFRRNTPLDALDLHLNSYLREKPVDNDNKENISPEPLKIRKDGPRKAKKKRTGIPVLQPLHNILNLSSPEKPVRSPARICVPRRTGPGKPCVKALEKQLNIFLVDSLTGLVNDATQFGTELNASNCEGFPMPEDVNEIVQIPTNDTVPLAAQKKMAIIKAFHSTRFPGGSSSTRGFYSKKEFDEYAQGKVKVLEEKDKFNVEEKDKRGVRWADDLEW